jgi:hypothetical protein
MAKATKMPPKVDDPGYWHFRAKNTRGLAEGVKEENERGILLNVAEQYEQLASMTEERRRQQLHERETHLRKLAEELLFTVEKSGEYFTLTRTADVSPRVRKKDLSLAGAEKLLETWKLRGPHGG